MTDYLLPISLLLLLEQGGNLSSTAATLGLLFKAYGKNTIEPCCVFVQRLAQQGSGPPWALDATGILLLQTGDAPSGREHSRITGLQLKRPLISFLGQSAIPIPLISRVMLGTRAAGSP